MLQISKAKITRIIDYARDYDSRTSNWDDAGQDEFQDKSAYGFQEEFAGNTTDTELTEFVSSLNKAERASLIALALIGRGRFQPEEVDQAIASVSSETVSRTGDYLLAIPMVGEYLEEGLGKLGYAVENDAVGEPQQR